MEDIGIRDLVDGDAEAVSTILRRGFNWWFEFQRKQGKDAQWFWDQLGPDCIRESVKKEGEQSKFIVAEVDGKVVGYIASSCDLGPRLGVIDIVSVDPEHHRRGIGSKLMRTALDFLKSRRVRKVCTMVSTMNTPAVIYYILNGFMPEGVLKSQFADGIDEIAMAMFLEQ